MLNNQLKIGSEALLTIKKIGINGEGIGYLNGTVVFVPGALPQEKVKIKIIKSAPNYSEGQLLNIIQAAKERITPLCPVYEDCGGCQMQHLAYPAQLRFKRDLIKQALRKYRPQNFEKFAIRPAEGMLDPWYYRNKAQFQLGISASGTVISGLYATDSHELIPINSCPVQEKSTTKVMQFVTKLLDKYHLPIYDERKDSGIVRTLMVRSAIATGEVQLVFITRSSKLPQKNVLLREIREALPEVVSIMQNVQDKKTSLVMGETTIHLWGKESIEEELNGVTFDLSPRAFFQLNPLQTSFLYEEALNALELKSSDHLIDAYCGVGTIGLSGARRVKEVRGMDTIPSAIEDAQANAKRMNLTNCRFETGKAEDIIPKWLKEGFTADAMVVDPPRTGLDEKLIKALLQFPPERLAYVSCNPSTLARDLVKLTKVYHVHYIQPVDMFPQTARGEAVVKLTHKT